MIVLAAHFGDILRIIDIDLQDEKYLTYDETAVLYMLKSSERVRFALRNYCNFAEA